MYMLPSASLTVTPLPCSRMTGNPPPPRVNDSYLADSSMRATTLGPGTWVTMLGASAQDSAISSFSRASVLVVIASPCSFDSVLRRHSRVVT